MGDIDPPPSTPHPRGGHSNRPGVCSCWVNVVLNGVFALESSQPGGSKSEVQLYDVSFVARLSLEVSFTGCCAAAAISHDKFSSVINLSLNFSCYFLILLAYI